MVSIGKVVLRKCIALGSSVLLSPSVGCIVRHRVTEAVRGSGTFSLDSPRRVRKGLAAVTGVVEGLRVTSGNERRILQKRHIIHFIPNVK